MPLKNNFKDFLLPDNYSLQDLRRVQSELLEMASLISSILEEHNIKYIISYGTLLGAVRHQGFVPWDDDFDMFLFDEEYDFAIDCLRNELPEHLIVHSIENDPLFFPAWCSVKNLKTVAEDAGLYNSDNQLLKYKCIGVDLYRIKKMNINYTELYKIDEAEAFFQRKLKFGIIDQAQFMKELSILSYKKNNIINGQKKNDNSLEVYFFFLNMKTGVTEESIFPLKRYTFEERFFLGPNDYDSLLKSSYGDYLSLPDLKQRKTHFKSVKFLD
jgi:lipopolysaccharide cholinephosphotransferase